MSTELIVSLLSFGGTLLLVMTGLMNFSLSTPRDDLPMKGFKMHRLIPRFSLLLSFLLGLAACGSSASPKDDDDDDTLDEISLGGDIAVSEPRFSPDGATIAFIQSSFMGDSYDLGVMDASGGQPTTLAPAETYLAAPAWAPDGKQIYFASNGGISVVPAAGGTASVAVMDFATMDPDVSPDGKSLVYGINGGSLKLIDLTNPMATPKDLGASGTSPRFSPDGLSIAFESGDMIKLMVISSGAVTDVVDAGTYLASVDWFPDGKQLAITSDKGLEIVTLGATPARALERDEFAATNVEVAPDGKKLAYTVNGSKSLFIHQL